MIERLFYRLDELAGHRWPCSVPDLLHLGLDGKAEIWINLVGVEGDDRPIFAKLTKEQARETLDRGALFVDGANGFARASATELRHIEGGFAAEVAELVGEEDGQWYSAAHIPILRVRARDLCILRAEFARLDREVFGLATSGVPTTRAQVASAEQFASTVIAAAAGSSEDSAPSSKRKRSDLMALEIDAALARLPAGTAATEHAVTAEFAKVAGKAGSCVTEVGVGFVWWKNRRGTAKRLSMDALRKRLDSLAGGLAED